MINLLDPAQPKKILIIGDSLSEYSGAFGLPEKLGAGFRVNDISRAGWDVPLWLSDRATIQANLADFVVVNLGTNDAAYGGAQSYAVNYSELVAFLESVHNWKLVLTLVTPTANPVLQARIANNNRWIRERYQHYSKIDLETVFHNNASLPLYPSYDPIHPNPIGYELIGEEYRKFFMGYSGF